MNAAAMHTLRTITDITLAYGVSDEYSFVFERDTRLFERRRDKLVSTVASTFTAAYIFNWNEYFNKHPDGIASSATPEAQGLARSQPLDPAYLPTFDARAITYPTTKNLRDYLSWRQVDCHINNLYNTTFWALVQQGGLSTTGAEDKLKGTLASDKNEILWSRFGVNYSNVGETERKGSVVYRDQGWRASAKVEDLLDIQGMGDLGADGVEGEEEGIREEGGMSKTRKEKMRKAKIKAKIVVEHVDIIKDEFWVRRPWILGGRALR